MTEDREYTVHSAEREVTPAFTLNQIGKFAYKQAVESERYPLMNLTTAQLMCALTMEAVLNRVGAKLFLEDATEPAVWAGVERLSPKKKLLAIAERSGLEVDFGLPPFHDFTRMFRFRDQLAHAKTMRLVTSEIPDEALDHENWLDHHKVPWIRCSSAILPHGEAVGVREAGANKDERTASALD